MSTDKAARKADPNPGITPDNARGKPTESGSRQQRSPSEPDAPRASDDPTAGGRNGGAKPAGAK